MTTSPRNAARLLLLPSLIAAVTLGAASAGPELATAAVSATAFHIGLASSVPAKDAHVMKAPTELRLTFTGAIDVSKATVELRGADSARVALGPLTAVTDSTRVAVVKITGPLKDGTHTVRWTAVAADGAAGSGSYSFMYMAPGKR